MASRRGAQACTRGHDVDDGLLSGRHAAMTVATHMTEASYSLTEPRLKPAEAADLLAVKPSWIYEAVRAGTLPCLKIGRHIRVTRPMLGQRLATRTRSMGDGCARPLLSRLLFGWVR
jgi:excisionase family DNA binding protein